MKQILPKDLLKFLANAKHFVSYREDFLITKEHFKSIENEESYLAESIEYTIVVNENKISIMDDDGGMQTFILISETLSEQND